MGASEQGVDPGRWIVIPRTLCFVTNGDDVLLMKRGEHKRAFPGRYNGLGGHLERDEDPQSGAIREIYEETGLRVSRVRFRGAYQINAKQAVGIMLFIFTAVSDSREAIECDEGSLHWVPLEKVYELPLVEDLPVLLPRLFKKGVSATPFFAHVTYDSADQMVMTFADPL